MKKNGQRGKLAVVYQPAVRGGVLAGICWIKSQSPLFRGCGGGGLQMTGA